MMFVLVSYVPHKNSFYILKFCYYFRTYVDGQGKKKISFSEKLSAKVTERPKSPVIKELQHYILPKIEESFKAYIIVSK
jgi:hypothetical protein